MKKQEDKYQKTKISITLSPETLDVLDEITINRSNLINSLLKQYFKEIGKNVEKIKL